MSRKAILNKAVEQGVVSLHGRRECQMLIYLI